MADANRIIRPVCCLGFFVSTVGRLRRRRRRRLPSLIPSRLILLDDVT